MHTCMHAWTHTCLHIWLCAWIHEQVHVFIYQLEIEPQYVSVLSAGETIHITNIVHGPIMTTVISIYLWFLTLSSLFHSLMAIMILYISQNTFVSCLFLLSYKILSMISGLSFLLSKWFDWFFTLLHRNSCTAWIFISIFIIMYVYQISSLLFQHLENLFAVFHVFSYKMKDLNDEVQFLKFHLVIEPPCTNACT